MLDKRAGPAYFQDGPDFETSYSSTRPDPRTREPPKVPRSKAIVWGIFPTL
jgi:hypothetical protein